MGKRLFTEKVVTDDILGTKGYHPPEVLFEESYDFRADIFMLGITFSIMVSTWLTFQYDLNMIHYFQKLRILEDYNSFLGHYVLQKR